MARISLVPQRKEFYELYRLTSANVVAIAHALASYLESFPGVGVEPIKELEHTGDRLARDAVAELFHSERDPIALIRWKEIYERLEDAVDACENAADVLEAILVKNK